MRWLITEQRRKFWISEFSINRKNWCDSKLRIKYLKCFLIISQIENRSNNEKIEILMLHSHKVLTTKETKHTRLGRIFHSTIQNEAERVDTVAILNDEEVLFRQRELGRSPMRHARCRLYIVKLQAWNDIAGSGETYWQTAVSRKRSDHQAPHVRCWPTTKQGLRWCCSWCKQWWSIRWFILIVGLRV
jgi:hypothetical protein